MPNRISEAAFAKHLHRSDIPDVDLFIRTSGEQRASNFLLWQAAYAEFVFQDKLWPDYDRRDLWDACEEYVNRNRRQSEIPGGGLMELADRLRAVLEGVLPFEEEDDGALTVHHDHTFASLRVVTIAEGLEMVSLTQILAWDLPLDNEIRDKVGQLAHDTVLGTVSLAEQVAGGGIADVTLRYNFPAAGLTDEALQTLVMMVLSTGADVRQALVGDSTPSRSRRAAAADAEDLDRVADVGEAVLACDVGRPRLHVAALHLDRAAAHPAHQVVMVMLGAAPVHRLAGVGAQGVDQTRPPPSTAGCGTRWSGRCPRRGGAVRRAGPGRTGSRRGSRAVPRSPRAAWWRARPAQCAAHSLSSAAWVTAATTMWARW